MDDSHSLVKSTIPWIEKYRPSSLDDINCHGEKVTTLRKFINSGNIPHLLFCGPPGTGKTSIINSVASQLYGEYKKFMVLELNASDSRGIDDVRKRVKKFVMTSCSYGPNMRVRFKLVILDEIDAMTDDAQAILRQIMEKYAGNARFCLICNFQNKISKALQSRCTMFKFSVLPPEGMMLKLNSIVAAESIKITDKAVSTIIERSGGDMRKAINILQSSFMIGTKKKDGIITDDDINKSLEYPTRKQIDRIKNILVEKNFSECFDMLISMVKDEELAVKDLINELNISLLGRLYHGGEDENDPFSKISTEKVYDIMSRFRVLDINQSTSISYNIHVAAIVSLFKMN